VWRAVQNSDVAFISGFKTRYDNCVESCTRFSAGYDPTSDENKATHRELGAALIRLGYGVTAVHGSWVNNFGTSAAEESKENTRLVVNLNNDPQFIPNVTRLGEEYCQDSVLIKPKGEEAYLYGTNKGEFPGYHNKVLKPDVHWGSESEFMTKVGNKAFFFEGLTSFDSYNLGAKSYIASLADPVLKKLGIQKSTT